MAFGNINGNGNGYQPPVGDPLGDQSKLQCCFMRYRYYIDVDLDWETFKEVPYSGGIAGLFRPKKKYCIDVDVNGFFMASKFCGPPHHEKGIMSCPKGVGLHSDTRMCVEVREKQHPTGQNPLGHQTPVGPGAQCPACPVTFPPDLCDKHFQYATGDPDVLAGFWHGPGTMQAMSNLQPYQHHLFSKNRWLCLMCSRLQKYSRSHPHLEQ